MTWTCACCLRILPDRAIENIVLTDEGSEVSVGSDCAKNIIEAGGDGFDHEKSGQGPFYTRAAWESAFNDSEGTEEDRYRKGYKV
jgi:hypothetical protein